MFKIGKVKLPHNKHTADMKDSKIPTPSSVTLPMSQYIGAPAIPIVKVGDKVKAGDIIGKCAEDKLCVPVHAPINGTVSTAESNFVVINAD